MKPNDHLNYLFRALIYHFNNKDYDRAIADITEAITIDSSDLYYNLRGDVYYAKGDYEHAIADYEDALFIDPNNTEYKQNLEKAKQARYR